MGICSFKKIDIEDLCQEIANNISERIFGQFKKHRSARKRRFAECKNENCELCNVDLGEFAAAIRTEVMRLFCQNIEHCSIDEYVELVLKTKPLNVDGLKRKPFCDFTDNGNGNSE